MKDFVSEERTGMGDFKYTPNPAPVGYGTSPEDGLPAAVSPVSVDQSAAQPLNPDRFVCMADESVWVLDEAACPDTLLDTDKPPQEWADFLVHKEVRGGKPVCFVDFPPGILYVRPRRPKCKHYVRQLLPFQGNDETYNTMHRYCTAFTDENSEFYSLNDTEMLACEMRSPRDFVSESRLREHDNKVIAAGIRAKTDQEDFDPAAALAGGIFGGS